MFYTTINEFKKYVLNEGGGAGIKFTTKVNISFTGNISATEFNIISKNINADEAFNAEGYQDGMHDCNSDKLISWSMPEITRDLIETIKLEDGTLLKDILSKYESISFEVECRFIYDNMHFGGWTRGKLKEGDLIFDQKLNRDGYDYEDFNISLTGNDSNGEDILDEDYDNNFINSLAPIGKGTEDFTYFWEDVFEFTPNPEEEVYDNVIDNDMYDEEIEIYMKSNNITLTLDEYKKSLENDTHKIDSTLYTYLNDIYNFDNQTNDWHWSNVKSEYGI